MTTIASKLFDIDWSRFDPWRVQPVAHRLAEHPMLQIDELMALCQRYERAGRVRTHNGQAAPGTSFNDAPRLHPNRKSAVQTLAEIEQANAWMSLTNVQNDPLYRTLVDEVLDDLQPGVDQHDPGMCYRGGWIFVTSPRAITPFHMDKEHGFIMQIRGTKTLYVWEPDDVEAVSEEARDLFHATHRRDLCTWRDELRKRAHVLHLQPGMGAYMPSTSPHMVENGDGPSITMSFSYYTQSTRRNAALHTLHQQLRERGFRPPAVGAHPMRDAAAYTLWRAYQALRGRLQRDGPRPNDGARYAHAALY